MYKDPTEFRKRFAAWKDGKKPYENGRISDELYVETMEKVAHDNWQQWGDESEDAALTRILNDNSYDYRGYYNKYPKGVGNAQNHWTDEFKTVWHPSFSIESKYSGKKSQYNPYGYPGGTWQGEFFTPLWYQQNPNAPGFYKDGYPRLPMYKNGKQPYKAGQVDKTPHEAFVELMGPTLYKELLRTNTSNIDTAYDYMLRQLAYESDYGRSRVAREQHNYGGYGWNGRTYTTFKDDADFVKHYVQLMNNRYGSAVNADSIQSYARALKDKGYYEDSLDNYTRNLAGMTSLSKSAKDHMLNNPTSYLIQPLSLAPITESLERVPLFLPTQMYASTDNTDYSLQNASIQSSTPRNINAWSGANSPAYGGNSIRMPSLLEYMQTGSVLPVGFKNGKLPGFAMGTEGDVDMGPKSKTYNKEAVKQILHELPLSPIDPIMSVYLGLTAIGKLFSLGRFYMKNRLRKETQQDYKQFRRNGYSLAASRNFVTDTYINDISKLADKMSRMLDFGL